MATPGKSRYAHGYEPVKVSQERELSMLTCGDDVLLREMALEDRAETDERFLGDSTHSPRKANCERANQNGDDFGSEVNLSAIRKFADRYTVGVKYASFTAGKISQADSDKIWLWAEVSF